MGILIKMTIIQSGKFPIHCFHTTPPKCPFPILLTFLYTLSLRPIFFPLSDLISQILSAPVPICP